MIAAELLLAIVWGALLIALIWWGIISAILHYHWSAYAIKGDTKVPAVRVYYVVSAVLLLLTLLFLGIYTATL